MNTALAENATSFRAMGCDCSVIVQDDDGQAAHRSFDQVKTLFRAMERRFSRFIPNSELSRLNQTGRLATPSTELVDVLQRAVEWSRVTEGLFNPAILKWLEEAGYDRSIEYVHAFAAGIAEIRSQLPSRLEEILRISDISGQMEIALVPDVKIDLGGIVKGWTVDRAAALLQGCPAYLIDAGGDIRVGTNHPDAQHWYVAIEDPLNPGADREIVTLTDGALATSGVYRRRWIRGNRHAHHLIDPRTGLPSASDVIAATVIAPSTEVAEIIAKTCLISGSAEAMRILERRPEAEGVITTLAGERILTPGWQSSLPLSSHDLIQTGAAQ